MNSYSLLIRASVVAQLVKNLTAMQKIQVQSLGWEDPLKEEMATHPSILAWRIPWTEEPGGLQSMGLQRVGDNWATNTLFLKWIQWFPHWLLIVIATIKHLLLPTWCQYYLYFTDELGLREFKYQGRCCYLVTKSCLTLLCPWDFPGKNTGVDRLKMAQLPWYPPIERWGLFFLLLKLYQSVTALANWAQQKWWYSGSSHSFTHLRDKDPYHNCHACFTE